MPIDTAFTLILKANGVITFITDRLDQMKLSETMVSKIKEDVKYLQLTIKKIEPHLKADDDTAELMHFLIHLQNASQTCSDISEKHTVVKFAKSGFTSKLKTIGEEIKEAHTKLLLFMTANNVKILSENIEVQNKKLNKIIATKENCMAGLNIVVDKSLQKPTAPSGVSIQENKNKLLLSWKQCEGTVDEYQVWYDEHAEDSIISVGKATIIELVSPIVQPGNIYEMKVRGINRGGQGEWSNTVVGQFAKPFPQKPEISNLLLRSTIAVVTVKIPGVMCNTESPVECIEILHSSTSSTKLSNREFKVAPRNDVYVFTLKELHPNTIYNFRAKSKNAEGWSNPSDLKEGNTLSVPPKPTKPNCPSIKACTSTSITLTVQVPSNTCSIKSPIIAWKISGYDADKEEVSMYYPLDNIEFMESSHNLDIEDLEPNQRYTLKLQARNEAGWSECSERFKIHMGIPSTPGNVRVSSKRTHSLIKIRWDAPDSTLITHYEIVKRTKKDNYDDEKAVKVSANKFSTTFTGLKQNKYYYFKVRTCNGLHASQWSKEIEANTRVHKGIKIALSPGVWALGTLGSPLLGAVGIGGMAANDKSGKIAVAAGAAGAAGGAALGIVTAPLGGAACAHYFVHGIDKLSDQSDDEDYLDKSDIDEDEYVIVDDVNSAFTT